MRGWARFARGLRSAWPNGSPRLTFAAGALVGLGAGASLLAVSGASVRLSDGRELVLLSSSSRSSWWGGTRSSAQHDVIEDVNGDALSSPPAHEAGNSKSVPLGRHAIADAVSSVSPAVVSVSCSHVQGDRLPFPFAFEVRGTGSGFIIDADGWICTNAHVVNSGAAADIRVTLQDGRSYGATVKGVDAQSDLAILKVNAPKPLPVAPLGSSKSLRPGEWVVAVGSPLSLSNSVTAGVISNVRREADEIGLHSSRMAYIQTDAAIQAGNSGGPLVDLDGRVIGINTMKVDGVDGIGFAIPSDTALQVIEQLREFGHVRRPFLGVSILSLTPANLEAIRAMDARFPAGLECGVLVRRVLPGGPAERGGLRDGDIVVAVDGKPTCTWREFTDALEIGKKTRLEVVRGRDGSRATLSVVPAPQSPS